jgi:hypothetical protein
MCHYVGIKFCEVIELPWAEVTQDWQGQVQTMNREQHVLTDGDTLTIIITNITIILGDQKSLILQPAI